MRDHEDPSVPADEIEPDPWAEVGRQTAHRPIDREALAEGGGDAIAADVMDADARETTSAPRKSIVPKLLIGCVFVGAIGFGGFTIWELYRKIFPSNELAAPSRSSEKSIPSAAAAEAAPPPAAPTLAGQSAAVPGTVIGAATATTAAAPEAQALTPAAAVPAVVVTATDSAVVTPPPPQQAASPAPAVATASRSAAPASAVAQASAQAKLVQPGPTVDPAAITSPAHVVAAPPKSRPPARRSTLVVEQPSSAGHTSRVARAVRDDQRAPSNVAARPHRMEGTRPAGSGVGTRTDHQGEVVETALGVMTTYRIESISPKTGDHQMAWVRRLDGGKLRIVSAGDLLDGMRVLQVDSARFAVRTNQGEIR